MALLKNFQLFNIEFNIRFDIEKFLHCDLVNFHCLLRKNFIVVISILVEYYDFGLKKNIGGHIHSIVYSISRLYAKNGHVIVWDSLYVSIKCL